MLRGMIESAIVGGSLWVLAETTPMPGFELNPWSAGAAGFTVWYAWYTTSRVIPKLVEDFREENRLVRENEAKNREAFREGLVVLNDLKQGN